MNVGTGYIVDKVIGENERNDDKVNWYLFRIPIREPNDTMNNISGFKTIRFIRTFLTGFEKPVVLRLAKFQMVGSQWRSYDKSLDDANTEPVVKNPFTVSVVNIEENSQPEAGNIPYVLPPGVEREQDNNTQYIRQANEQSLQICVDDLADGEANAVYKNMTIDMINYGRLKMFLHAEAPPESNVNDDEVTAFIRLGTDFTDNYYEIEVPLKITPSGSTDRREILALGK